jgi:hypothetical protein
VARYAYEYLTLFRGHLLLYNKCVCEPWCQAWRACLQDPDRFLVSDETFKHLEFDCTAYGDPYSCAHKDAWKQAREFDQHTLKLGAQGMAD